jgi:hypothetical protein
MSLLSELPVELLNSIYTHLDNRKDVLSLRHTSRNLAAASLDEFDKQFGSITVTSSLAGLTRLRHLVADAGNKLLTKITHITLHTLTIPALEGLAMCMQRKSGSPYLHAYAYTRTVLINCLNRLPSLERIAITNHPFKNTPLLIRDQPESSDPLLVTRPHLHAFDSQLSPHLHAFESALSILPALHNKNIELYLSIDATSPLQINLEYPTTPHVLSLDSTHFSESLVSFELQRRHREIMFGAKDFETKSIIIEKLMRMDMLVDGAYIDDYWGLLDVVEEGRCEYMQVDKCGDERFGGEWGYTYEFVCAAEGHGRVGNEGGMVCGFEGDA